MSTTQELLDEIKMITASLRQEYALVGTLKPRIFVDKGHWCVLWGENLQDGVAGFGKTPHLAVLDFNDNWHKPLEDTKPAPIPAPYTASGKVWPDPALKVNQATTKQLRDAGCQFFWLDDAKSGLVAVDSENRGVGYRTQEGWVDKETEIWTLSPFGFKFMLGD